MTRDEFYKKYGDVKVKFDYYYKYTFTFTGVLPNGNKISVGYGGNSDDIYRYDVSAGVEVTINEIYPYMGCVTQPDGVELESFYDY